MFGFLKQKIADFGNKLKQTAKEKEEAEQEKPLEKEKQKEAEKKGPKQEKKQEVKEPAKEEKKEAEKEKKEEAKQEEKKHEEQKKEEVKIKADSKEKKTGFLGKLFGSGKKKEEKTKVPEEEKGKRKKTKEEIAAELEAKMFKEIEGELKKEGVPVAEAGGETTEEKLEEDLVEKEEIIEEKKEAIKEAQKKSIEKIIEAPKEAKEPQADKIIEEAKKMEVVSEAEEEVLKEDEELKEIEEQEKKLAQQARERTRDIRIKTLEEEKRELKAQVGVGGKVKGFLFGGVEITEREINDLLWELELSLIESDVEQDAAGEIVKQIKARLVGKKVSSKNLDDYLKEQIKEILAEMMSTKEINLLEEAKEAKKKGKPLIMLMLGPNGAGKTTSIAKLVHYFKKHKLTSIIAAGDTFRAGAIDQIEEHARRLEVRVIKQQYGADPAAVSFDAIKAAEAGKIDVVIIDSAGRQETNKNLMEELRKIERVAKPDLKIYVGEAYVGQALLEQVAEFEEMVGIDGFILTKIDTDAKGGTAISLVYKTKKPIIFVGTGQGYDDFKEFTPEFILERII